MRGRVAGLAAVCLLGLAAVVSSAPAQRTGGSPASARPAAPGAQAFERVRREREGTTAQLDPERSVIELLLKAAVTFFGADAGGRICPPSSGYRAPTWFGDRDPSGEPACWDFEFQFVNAFDTNGARFDEETPALMRAASATAEDLAADVGATFEVREGARVVGRGHVTEVLSG